MAGLTGSQEHHHHGGFGHQAHPGPPAVGEHHRRNAKQQGCGGKGFAGQSLPAQQGHQGQRDRRQQEASQQVGVVEGSVDADGAVGHRIGIGPTGQFGGVAKQLAKAHHAGDQFTGQ